MKLFKIMHPLLSESERGDAFLRISNMSDNQVLKVIKKEKIDLILPTGDSDIVHFSKNKLLLLSGIVRFGERVRDSLASYCSLKEES